MLKRIGIAALFLFCCWVFILWVVPRPKRYLDIPESAFAGQIPIITRQGLNDYQCLPAPGNPPSGYVRVYCDSSTGNLTAINSSGSSALQSGGGFNGVSAQTTNYTAVSGDSGKLITMSGSSLTLTLPNPAPSATWYIYVENLATSNLTISRNSLTINGAASNITILGATGATNGGVIIFSDGTNYFTGPFPGAPTSISSSVIAPNVGTFTLNSNGATTYTIGSSSNSAQLTAWMANVTFGVNSRLHLNTQSANGDFAGVLTCSSSTATKTFFSPYNSTPVILVSDDTTSGGAKVSAKSASAFTITCVGASDVVDYIVIGNPN